VAVRVEHDGEQCQRVRLANECAGPVWPPREDGLPEPGWDDGGWEGVLDPGERKPLGYATPGEPTDPPVTVAWTERAAEGPPDASEAVAQCGDPRPPRDAIPEPDTALPDSVRDWLGSVSTRASEDKETPGDREAVSALAARASVLRERVDE
jgi:hypothetical protein